MKIATDLRIASRLFVRNPLFTAIVVITMAITIGLNTVVFAAVDSLLLRPLPGASAPDRIVQLYRTSPGIPWGSNSIPHYQDVRERTTDVFDGVAAWSFASFSVSNGDRPRRLMGQVVSANFFSTLGAQPALGRFFLPEEDIGRGAHPVVVLGHGGWRSMFGGDSGIIGRDIMLNGQKMQVVGVASPEFRGVMPLIDPIAFVPLMQLAQIDPERARSFESRGNNFMNIVARLKTGVSPEQARTRLTAVNTELAGLYPDSYIKSGTVLIRQADAGIHPSLRTAQVSLSAVIMAVVALLLLVACVNVSSLFLARAHDRGREMALRIAIGATRVDLLRQLLTESLLFATAAGAAGILIAIVGIGLANEITLPMDVGFRPDLRLNFSVLAFTLTITLVAGVLFGLAPALHSTRPSLVPSLKGESILGDGRSRMKHVLVVTQMALSIVLLTCAGLFLTNLRTATTLDVGFQPEGAVTASVAPSLQGYTRAQAEQFYRSLFDRLNATAGVTAVGMIDALPLGLGNSDTSVEIPGYVPAEGEGMNINYASISPGYFAAMGTRLVSGRAFTSRDDSAATKAIIVNQRFVDRFWPGQDAIGRVVKRGSRAFTVVGVTPTGKYVSLGEEPKAFMYFAQAQTWTADMQLVVRGRLDAPAMLGIVRQDIQALDAQMPVVDLQTLTAHLGTSLLPARVAGGALGLFGVIGLLLAGIGLYGVMAHTVRQRTREVGIRMALGATTSGVTRLVMAQGLRLVLIGCAIGIVGAGGVLMLIRGVLYGAASVQVLAFVGAPLVLLAVATVALVVPALRAARLDPQVALRTT